MGYRSHPELLEELLREIMATEHPKAAPEPEYDAEDWIVFGADTTGFNEGVETAALHLETMGLKLAAREIRDLKTKVEG